ncbi:phosphate-binding protein, partial [Aquibacillus sp. 3ASR75-54]|nr:phosphate-binding protein [Aquibacillus salsiterrae]
MIKNGKISLLAVLLILLIGLLAACGSGDGGNASEEDTNGTNDSNSTETEELTGSVIISGSSAMQPLVAAAAEEFMNQNPGTDIQVNAG